MFSVPHSKLPTISSDLLFDGYNMEEKHILSYRTSHQMYIDITTTTKKSLEGSSRAHWCLASVHS